MHFTLFQNTVTNLFFRTIHSLQKNRTDLKILSGTAENPNLHRLNGNVVTPLFHHLGASSWHSFDASLIVKIGRLGASFSLLCCISVFLGVFFLVTSWGGLLHVRLRGSRKLPPRSQSPVESKSLPIDSGVKSA